MKTSFLFPNKFKTLGWIVFIPAFASAVLIPLLNISTDNYLKIKVFAICNDELLNHSSYFSIIENSIVDELLLFALIIGGILIGFSKLKTEDELTSKIRYESLVWATYLNYGLILIFTAFIYGMSYLNVLFYNTFTLLLFFIIRFHYSIYKLNKSTNDDE
ncbi:MAG TPA: hypothetical protein PKN96_11675 [Flavobacterium sp.]|uniref:hypothetical protein n=1 Tax=Flavobacterium sp. TaxID=239 RepID=UPI002C41F724|nr:hypothetical protein [Flavobacterium sp.]HNP33941.1 hypothetical protein [Flavobacterium sp.]